jgi:AraC family transcriptional regulator of adaptative response / DNA-3-methyladenine glycosylase II
MLPAQVMLDRFLARDRSYDGRFLTGVVTTGIYCLPSCPARKPRPDNVRFFSAEEQAHRAGFRPCRRCRPDLFYRGAMPDDERLRGMAAAVVADPSAFQGVDDLARAAGFGRSRVSALFRDAFHGTPAAWLLQRRVEHAAGRLVSGTGTLLAAGLDAGFESASAFHENFRRFTGLTPRGYRDLRRRSRFRVALPDGLRVEDALGAVVRDPVSPAEGRSSSRVSKGVVLPSGPAIITLEVRGDLMEVCVLPSVGDAAPEDMVAAHTMAIRMLGMLGDPAVFERRAARGTPLRAHVRRRPGLRIPLTATPFEALTWAILGQQVNLPFAMALRRDLIALCGRETGGGLLAHPTAADVARLDLADLTSIRLSRRKAEYLAGCARDVTRGALSLDPDPTEPFASIERRLLRVRGLGPWSVHYFLMRGLGFADCVPVGDSGLGAALEAVFALSTRPDPASTLRLMEPFRPFRSLATFHLWAGLQDENPPTSSGDES